METVNIAFSSNDNHAMLLGVALCSIFENKRGDYPINIFVMDGGISEANKKRLAALEEQYKFNIKYVVPDDRLFNGVAAGDRSIAAFYRTVIDQLLPNDCRKVIYMDCDVIVRGDIKELFFIELDGKTIGAALDLLQDVWRKHLEEICKSIPSLSRPSQFTYFNSGVLLIDLDRWRSFGIGERLLAFIHANPDKLLLADQDPLNVIFMEDRKTFTMRYNFPPVPENHSLADPLILHFSGGAKPWYFLSALPYHEEYVYYANKTAWKNKKYRKFMDIYFAKRYHIYGFAWGIWNVYKEIRSHF